MKRETIVKNFVALSLFLSSFSLMAQTEDVIKEKDESTEKIEMLPYGNMNTWMVRQVKESGIIGGNVRTFHEIAKGDTLFNEPYSNIESPWALSSVLARVSGVTKASYTVFPEKRGNGFAARLETKIEGVKVLGLININVLASGTIFLGEMLEPITSTSDPMSKLDAGIPFTKRPKALQYDYKVITGGDCIRSTGFSGQKKLNLKDEAEVFLLLQHRWEDADGNLFAKRIATGWENYSKSEAEWQNNHRVQINYGDITSQPYYKDVMGLSVGERAHYAKNSKGKMVPVTEMGWGTEKDEVTHLMLQFSSSNGGAYIGSVDSRLWIDNVALVY